MDGADKVHVSCGKGASNCPPPNAQFQYVQASDAGPYFQWTEQYTFGDRMFQTNQGPAAFPAHQFIMSGTSALTATSNLFIAENAGGVANAGGDTGCTSPPAESVYQIDPAGNESSTMCPCTDHPALTDELNAKSISWCYYTPSAGSLWTGPNAIQDICGPNNPPSNATACTGSDWVHNVVLDETQVLNESTKRERIVMNQSEHSEGEAIAALWDYLDGLAPGQVRNTGRLETLVAPCWEDLPGSSDGGMESNKLFGRMESVEWSPPLLTFKIERHGGASLGSSRDEIQPWAIDISKRIASLGGASHRQLRPSQPRCPSSFSMRAAKLHSKRFAYNLHRSTISVWKLARM